MKTAFYFLVALVCLSFTLPKSALAQCPDGLYNGDVISQTGQRTPLYGSNNVSGDYVTIQFPYDYPTQYTFEVVGSSMSYVQCWDYEADLVLNHSYDMVTVRITKTSSSCGTITQDFQFFPDPYSYSALYSPTLTRNQLLAPAPVHLALASSKTSFMMSSLLGSALYAKHDRKYVLPVWRYVSHEA